MMTMTIYTVPNFLFYKVTATRNAACLPEPLLRNIIGSRLVLLLE